MTAAKRILVVDDQQEILDVTAMVLDAAGYETTTVSSGSEALRRLGTDPYDLVLLDINMPEMDGWETLRLVRADEDLADLAVVMFSIKGEVRDKVQCLQEGASGYITKPYVVDELIERIERVLESSGAGSKPPPDPRSGSAR
jgi:two-component system alkaline phosphatase synthesis response regulator PhoP